MSPIAYKVLCSLAEAYRREDWANAEIVASHGDVRFDYERTSHRVVNQLLAYLAVSHSNDGGCDHYAINETGLAICRRPELAWEIMDWIMHSRGPLTLTADDKIIPMPTEKWGVE